MSTVSRHGRGPPGSGKHTDTEVAVRTDTDTDAARTREMKASVCTGQLLDLSNLIGVVATEEDWAGVVSMGRSADRSAKEVLLVDRPA